MIFRDILGYLGVITVLCERMAGGGANNTGRWWKAFNYLKVL